MTPPTDGPYQQVGRRTLIRSVGGGGVAATFLVACGSDDEGESSEESSASTVPTADVAVGSGVIVDDTYVVTQPTEGDFKAFTAICTHNGCVVASVEDNTINCNCHGSQFDAETGEPVSGPNGSDPSSIDALAEEPLSVDGDTVTIG